MSKTPRTDAIREGIDARSRLRGFPTPQDLNDLTDLSRQLETENAELREALKSLYTNVEDYFGPSKIGAAYPKFFDASTSKARAILEKTK